MVRIASRATGWLLAATLLIAGLHLARDAKAPLGLPAPSQACTSFCVDTGDGCVFGANQDNPVDAGTVVVKKRYVLKTGWEAGTTGQYARWIARYGSVTFDYAGYQMAWAGMNEAGLMISTMALDGTHEPEPDARPPLASALWVQYQLDNHATVAEVINSDSRVRITMAVDHYLVCDRSGECAVIEFLDGKMVHYSGDALPVKALSNSAYSEALHASAEQIHVSNSLQRFGAVTKALAFAPASSKPPADYAFDILAGVALPFNAWRIVFDPLNLRVYWRTNHNPAVRWLDLADLNFSCRTPVMVMDVHADGALDVSDRLTPYSHPASLRQSLNFVQQFDSVGFSPLMVDALLRGMESFACREGDPAVQSPGPLYVEAQTLLPPTVQWAVRMVACRVGPGWLALAALSLAFVLWRLSREEPLARQKWWAWAIVVALLGPLGLLAYLVSRRRGPSRAAAHGA